MFARWGKDCFQREQAPQEESSSAKSTGTALRLHVAGEICARNMTATFAARRAAYNAEKRRLTVPLIEAHLNPNYYSSYEIPASLPGNGDLKIPIYNFAGGVKSIIGSGCTSSMEHAGQIDNRWECARSYEKTDPPPPSEDA